MKKNPFSVLGVPDTASDEQIRNAYRELARKYSDSSDDGKMQELNDAYDQIVMLRGGLGGSSSSSSRSSSYANNTSDLSDIREKIRSGRIEDALVLLDGIPEQYPRSGIISRARLSRGAAGSTMHLRILTARAEWIPTTANMRRQRRISTRRRTAASVAPANRRADAVPAMFAPVCSAPTAAASAWAATLFRAVEADI